MSTLAAPDLPHTPAAEQAAASRGKAAGIARQAFVDNLRWSMIVLVLSMHAADTYSPFGNWYYADKAHTGRTAAFLFGTWQSFLQAFFMSLLFAVSGYFARPSLLRKGRKRFCRERFVRLGIPVLLYMLVIGPLTQFYVSHSWRPPQGTPFLAEWWRHIADGEVLSESGPLWFCVALLAFSLAYACMPIRARAVTTCSRIVPRDGRIGAFIGALAIMTFLIRLSVPEGRAVFNLQFGDFGQYAPMFAAGVLANRDGWPLELRPDEAKRWLALGLCVGSVGWIALVVFGGALQGNFDAYAGGWHWQAAAKATWESFVCVAMSLGLLAFYRNRLDFTNRVFAFLSANAFAVYVFHPPILIAIARAIRGWPAAVGVKFLVLWLAATVASYAFAAAIARRLPVLRSVL